MKLCIVLIIFFTNDIFADIITIAGNGTFGFSGDGSPATQAQLNRPTTICIDSLNNIYIVDGNNGCIRKIDNNGIITTIAGTGTEGFSGDGKLATQAQLNRPHGITIDTNGNIYISDTRNNRIRKIDNNGIITTIAGTGNAGLIGDGETAIQAELNRPHGIAIDTVGTLYIADTNNDRIRKIDNNGIITTHIANLNNPVDVALDANNALYISERTSARVLMINNDSLTVLAGNGQSGFAEDGTLATQAPLSGLRGITVSPQGTVFFAEKDNQRIRRITQTGTLITVAGNGTRGDAGDQGPALEAQFNFPWGIFIKQDSLYIADRENHRIRKVTLTDDEASISADFNNDQQVNFQDFLLFVPHFGSIQNQESYDMQFDLDANGEIGFSDFLIFAQAFGK